MLEKEDDVKVKKAIEVAKTATQAAKQDCDEAFSEVKSLKGGDAKALENAKKILADTKAIYEKKIEVEYSLRVKASQTDGYLPELTERRVFHVRLDKQAFNPLTGEKITRPILQKFTVADWNQFINNSLGLGYVKTILWDPTFYNL
jgi:hypothetical protein